MVDPSTAPLVEVVGHLALAFGIGALVGLEREQSESGGTFAGSRTFPLIALYGALVAGFFPDFFPLALGILALALTVAYAGKVYYERDIGLTTLVAALLVAILGAMTITLSQLAARGEVTTSVATTGVVIAAIANTGVKAGLAWALGSKRLGKLVTIVLAAVVLSGVASLAFV